MQMSRCLGTSELRIVAQKLRRQINLFLARASYDRMRVLTVGQASVHRYMFLAPVNEKGLARH